MGKIEVLYRTSPVKFQNLMVSSYGLYWHFLRFGGKYLQHKKDYQSRELYNDSQWQKWQSDCLKQLLSNCVEYVPYYRENWTTAQKKAACLGNLSNLPFIGKEPIRENASQFCDERYQFRKIYTFHTSGSTGTPIATRWTASEIQNSLALREVRSMNWGGVSYKLPRATFSGRMVEPDPDSKGPFHRYNIVERQVYFSAFHLKPENAKQYVDALWKHTIQWMTGYAVSYFLLAKFIVEQNIQVPPLKAVITTSEKLTDEMRSVMEAAYHCKIFEEYSTVENAIFASECECGKLHVSPDVGIVEILRPDGSPCEPGEVGEVVTTCLMRSYQPMIRFRLGDMAAWDDQPCACGRSMPVIKEVVGRIEDVVIGPDGRQLVRFHGIFANQPNVIEGQIIQEELNKIVVKVVPTSNFSMEDEQDIVHRIHNRLADQVLVEVVKVDLIPRTKAGKFKAVISKVKQ